MTKNAGQKKRTRILMEMFGINFVAAQRILRGKRCAFGGCDIDIDDIDSGEEIAELWSEKLQDTVFAHPDCCPNFTAIINGDNHEWKTA